MTPGKILILDARGTGEPYSDDTMLGHVYGLVRRDHPDVEIVHVQYDAALGVLAGSRDPLAKSGDNAADAIVAWLVAFIAQLGPNDRYIVLGYSLGAVGTTRWLKLHGHLDRRCLMVGHIASPSRAAGTSYGVNNGVDVNPWPQRIDLRSGIYSTQGSGTVPYHIGSPVPLVEIANPNDVMTSCPKYSPLHSFAGPVMAFTLADPVDLVDELLTGGEDGNGNVYEIMAALLTPENWLNPGWSSWPFDLQAYMTHSHTTDYGLPLWRNSAGKFVSGITLLGAQISWRITRAKAGA